MSTNQKSLSEERMRELLKPLQTDKMEYLHQYERLSEFSRRLRSLESLYAEVYSKIATLEKQLKI